jgi:hypothetical protein
MAFAIVLPVVAIAAFFAGGALHGDEIAESPFDLESGSYSPAQIVAGESEGGFSGFGAEGALEGEAIVTGAIARLEGGAVVIETDAGESNIRLTGDDRLRTIETGRYSDVAPGQTLVVRLKPGSLEAEGLLIVLDP